MWQLTSHEHLVARLRVDLDADLVGHGARRHEQGRFLAEQVGDAFFQLVDGGILAEDVVAHWGPAMAARMPGVGWVTVSLRRSIRVSAMVCSRKT